MGLDGLGWLEILESKYVSASMLKLKLGLAILKNWVGGWFG